jgi:hypothetical protein
VRLTPSDLAAIYLGGFTPVQLARAGRVDSNDASEMLEAMIRTDIAPYCSGTF